MEKGGVARPMSSLGGKVHRKAPPPNHSETSGIIIYVHSSILYIYLSPPPVDDTITPEMSATLKKALSSIANVGPAHLSEATPTSPSHALPTPPTFRVQRPTVRVSNKKPPLRNAGSTDNLISGGSPLHRPSSRSGVRSGIRPPSRSGMLLKKKSSELLLPGKQGTGMRLSRSHQPSPAHRLEWN